MQRRHRAPFDGVRGVFAPCKMPSVIEHRLSDKSLRRTCFSCAPNCQWQAAPASSATGSEGSSNAPAQPVLMPPPRARVRFGVGGSCGRRHWCFMSCPPPPCHRAAAAAPAWESRTRPALPFGVEARWQHCLGIVGPPVINMPRDRRVDHSVGGRGVPT